jgi:hypothetical protein
MQAAAKTAIKAEDSDSDWDDPDSIIQSSPLPRPPEVDVQKTKGDGGKRESDGGKRESDGGKRESDGGKPADQDDYSDWDDSSAQPTP